jgi:hypothetical protein
MPNCLEAARKHNEIDWQSYHPQNRDDGADFLPTRAREVLANQIVDLAKLGERDADGHADKLLEFCSAT